MAYGGAPHTGKMHKWYFFRLADISDGVYSDVKFLIKQCFFHAVVPPRFPLGRNRDAWYNLSDVENIESSFAGSFCCLVPLQTLTVHVNTVQIFLLTCCFFLYYLVCND